MNPEKIEELKRIISRDYSNISGIVIHKNGRKVFDCTFNGFPADTTFHVFSVTKSIICTLIGIAIDKGYISSANEKVLDFFPEYKPKRGEKTAQRVTIRELLTMTAPFKYKSAPYTKYFTSESWVTSALDLLGGKEEIGQFRYTPLIGPDILSGILTNATGQSVLQYAYENLFSPLEIEVMQNVVFATKEEQLSIIKHHHEHGWVADPQGINTAGWGLFLTPQDMAKIGQLYLGGGIWDGKQIVSADWIAESTKVHSRWDALNLSYGYLWWIIDGDSYAALGDGGNAIYVNTKNAMVVSIASCFKPTAKDRIQFIKEHVEPMFLD